MSFDLTLELAQTILDRASSAIIAINADQKIVYANQWASHIFGYAHTDLLDQPMSLLLPPEAVASHRQHVKQFMTRPDIQKPMDMRPQQLYGRHKDGTIFPTDISISHATVEGQPLAIAIINDITERRTLEEAEHRERQLAETLKRTAEILARSLNLPTTLDSIRQELATVCRYDQAVILLLEGDHLIPAAGEATSYNYTDSPCLHNALTTDTILTVKQTTGRPLPGYDPTMQDWIGIPLVTDDVTVGLLSIGHYNYTYTPFDMTAAKAFARQAAVAVRSALILNELENSLNNLKTVQDSLIRAARLSSIGELAAGVAHQINNPLMTIVADSALIVKKAPPGSTMAESAQAIQRAAKRAGVVVQRLLHLSRTHQVERHLVDVNASLREAFDLVRSQIEPTVSQFSLTLAPDLPPVWGDYEHLEDVFINLLINARDAVTGQPESRITVTTSTWAAMVTISIEDNGTGIPSDVLDHIFDPFFTTKETGTGLGLSVCYDIVKEHNGVLDVTSQPGIGTTFLIHLPKGEKHT